MPIIKIEVKGNVATLKEDAFIVCGNSDYQIEFEFDEIWSKENIKTARLYYNFKHIDIVFDGSICPLPALEETQLLKVGVFTDNVKTSTDAEIKCRYSIKKYGGNVHETTPDVYAQIIELLNMYIEQGGGGGGINREEVEQIIKDYFVSNPVEDGFSPLVVITEIENGHKVSITDINGEKSFNVLNGKDGTSVETDKTLTIENAPADAKAVGEALETKLNKFEPTANSTAYAYIAQRYGTGEVAQTQRRVGGGAIAGAIPVYGAGGTLLVGTPTMDTQATPKKYVDELVASSSGGKHTHLLTIKDINSDRFTIKFEHPNATPLSFEELSGDMDLYTRGLNVKFDGSLGLWRIVDTFKNNQIRLADTSEPDPGYDTMTLYATQEEAEAENGAYILSYLVV